MRSVRSVDASILIVSPVRNEAAHIERVVRAVAAQELRPARWIVIDDASTDETEMILRRLARQLPFMTVLRGDRDQVPAPGADRLARAAAPRTFNAGLAAADPSAHTHIMKLDGDIELPPHYLRTVVERQAADRRIGLAGGVLVEPMPGGGLRPIRIAANHVHGALKCWTRECFEAIGGVQERLGWDTIDETYARMLGFSTPCFADLVSIHHRPLASADGVLRGRARHGTCAYIAHYPPSWVALRSIKVARSRPRVLSGAAFAYGYARAAARRTERVDDPAYRSFTRRELRRRMVRELLAAVSPRA